MLTYLGMEGSALSPSVETKWTHDLDTEQTGLMLELHLCNNSFVAMVIFRKD